MEAYLVEWANLLVRWLHLIAGIAWIGASFHFIGLDLTLEPPKEQRDRDKGVMGEQWAVHGGGFYHKQKYLLAPPALPERLHWFKWEAYTTWLSGMGMLAIVYWIGASTYLIDPDIAELTPAAAIGISVACLMGGWLVYDTLCDSPFGRRESVLALVGFALMVAAAYGLTKVFSGRGAYIHVGAIIGTIMVANVFFVIIPGQRQMVRAIAAGRAPDAEFARRGKQRSVHNNYLTLPVLFLMISSHYPMTYGHPYAWAILAVIALVGVLVRHFYNLRHVGTNRWALPAAAAVLVIGLVATLAPPELWRRPPQAEAAAIPFDRVRAVINERCLACHARQPTQPGIAAPPQGVVLETPAAIRRWAARINDVAVVRQTMPAGNLTEMTDEERRLLGAWFAAGAPTN
jgi:uncharacterized membrane protein